MTSTLETPKKHSWTDFYNDYIGNFNSSKFGLLDFLG